MNKWLLSFFISFLLVFNLSLADEGMYPISEILKLNLRAKGLKLDPKELYNPNGVSLIDAVVLVGGCTGSFISNEGLILTNHHCAFGAVQAISTKENDYITNGFLAQTREKEAIAKGLTVRITESYRNVSKEVLRVVNDNMELAERTKAIDKKIREIVAETEGKNPGKRAEVSEMFAGRSYVLFVYANLKDIRLVYVPPRSIGEFGGENDNWVWPRHTGDFSFLRAYVAPDGTPVEFSPDNVPYHPKRFLKVNPAGVDEGDFVFILGYPGRTFRHRTSHYLEYEERYRLPYIANLYEWEIATMEAFGKSDRAVAIKHDSRIKSLANTMKNYKGKLQGMARLHLVDRKREEEKALQRFINADAKRSQLYGTVLEEIGNVYQEMTDHAKSELILDQLVPNTTTGNMSISTMLSFGYYIYEATKELQKQDLERVGAYMERNFSNTKTTLRKALDDYYEPTDKTFLKEMLLQAARLPANQRISALDALFNQSESPEQSIDRFLEQAYAQTILKDEHIVMDALSKNFLSEQLTNDPFVKLAQELYPIYQKLKETRRHRDGALNRLSALLVDVKQQFQKTNFIPDANRTLRLTYGYIKGYSPADATYYSPITTLKGVIEKTTGVEPFNTPNKTIDLYRAKDFGRFKHPKLNDVPVAILYNTDTTGGNSGSSVINASGELTGVNFDRAFEATINDYAWSDSYSRSIAVDIRYVLWVTQKIAGADYLLKEMGVR